MEDKGKMHREALTKNRLAVVCALVNLCIVEEALRVRSLRQPVSTGRDHVHAETC